MAISCCQFYLFFFLCHETLTASAHKWAKKKKQHKIYKKKKEKLRIFRWRKSSVFYTFKNISFFNLFVLFFVWVCVLLNGYRSFPIRNKK